MSQIAFVVNNPALVVADSPSFLDTAAILVQLVKNQLPVPDAVALSSVAVASTIVVNPVVNLLAVVGGAAGDITVTGVTAASVLYKVEAIKDSDQTLLHLGAEFTTASGKINNVGGTDTTGYHLVVVWR